MDGSVHRILLRSRDRYRSMTDTVDFMNGEGRGATGKSRRRAFDSSVVGEAAAMIKWSY